MYIIRYTGTRKSYRFIKISSFASLASLKIIQNYLVEFFVVSKIFYIFAVSPYRSPLECGADEDGDLYIGKALSDALFLTLRNLAVPNE